MFSWIRRQPSFRGQFKIRYTIIDPTTVVITNGIECRRWPHRNLCFEKQCHHSFFLCRFAGAPSLTVKPLLWVMCLTKLLYFSIFFSAGWDPPNMVFISILLSGCHSPSPLDLSWFHWTFCPWGLSFCALSYKFLTYCCNFFFRIKSSITSLGWRDLLVLYLWIS